MVEICSPTFFGFAFADEKHEEIDLSNVLSNVYLGVLTCTDFSTLLSHGSIIVGITQKRRKKLRDLVDTALAARVVPGAITQSIIGKARLVLSAAFSSIGKACLQPLRQHAAQREPHGVGQRPSRPKTPWSSFGCSATSCPIAESHYSVPRQPPSSSSPTPKASNAKGTMHPPGIFGSRSSTHARIVLVVRTSPGEHRDAPRRSAQTRHLDWAIRGDCGHFSIPQLPTGVFSRGAQSNYGSTILGL